MEVRDRILSNQINFCCIPNEHFGQRGSHYAGIFDEYSEPSKFLDDFDAMNYFALYEAPIDFFETMISKRRACVSAGRDNTQFFFANIL